MKFRFVVVIAAAIAAILALAGCNSSGSDSGSGDGGGSGQDAATLLQQSAEATRALTGAHVVLTAEGQVPNVKVTTLEADIATKPAPVGTGTVTLDMGDAPGTAQIIYVDGHLYSDIAEPGTFVDYGDGNSIYNISVLLDANNGLANALTKIKDPKSEGGEDIDGTKTTKVSGTVSTNDVSALVGLRRAPEKEKTLPITVWIADGDPHHLVRAQIAPTDDAKITMTFSEFGKQVTATKPAV
jgi:lipoprotein LprA